MKKFDVIVVGAGPAGLFACIELIKKSEKKLSIALIDKGKKVSERKDLMCGIGGAGMFSDGKLHFSPVLSHGKLFDLWKPSQIEDLCNYVDSIFTEFGVNSEYYPKNVDDVQGLIDFCKVNGVELVSRRVRHVGSDLLPKIIKKMEEFLIKNNVQLFTETNVEDIFLEKNEVKGVKAGKENFLAEKVLLAPGRVNAKWMQELAARHGLKYGFEEAEIGVRVEFPATIMKRFADLMYEAIFLVHSDKFDDVVRTFCPCPKGEVALEEYQGFVCVNGHSNSTHKSDNSNFALLSKIQLTEPVTNTIDYARSIAEMASTIGGGKPIVQRLKDLRKGRRSTWKRIEKSYVKPTLLDVTPGDISMALPHRVVSNLLEALEKLDRVMPGIASDATLLYAPEIKLRTSKIQTNAFMETSIKNFFVAGDGAGVSGNITGAAVGRVLAARGMLELK